jgi:putative membrane protein
MMLAFDYTILAEVDALLNATATILIIAGLIAIKRGHERAHKILMLSATVVSAAFLVSYLTYHYHVGQVKYTGSMRPLYLAILIPHVILAVVQLPLIFLTIRAGLRDERAKHRRLARITAPMWLFVSITGVVIYCMLWM